MPLPATRTPPTALGKIEPSFFRRVIAPRLGTPRAEVLVGPGAGSDCAILRLGGGKVMAVTTDPLSLIPALGPELSAWLACQLVASDLWTSGIPPHYAALDFNLPPALSDNEFEAYWQAMSAAWAALGVAVVSGHTGRYEGCDYSIIGAGTLMGVGDENGYVTPTMASQGDHLLVTKGCAVAATAIAAHLFPERLGTRLDTASLSRARASVRYMTCVPDCQALLRIGVRERGVTAMHDAAEGGVLGGLIELAQACGHGLRVERARIPRSDETRAACEALGGIDPYWSVSEGTLIAAVRPNRCPAALEALAAEGIPAAEVGGVVGGPPRLEVVEADGRLSIFHEPLPDPYWPAYSRAVAEGWK